MSAPLAARPVPRLPGAPQACQWGHPITWVLLPDHEHAAGEALGVCACSYRKHNEKGGRGASTPTLWRWVVLSPLGVRPVFLTQNRLAFALALQMARAVDTGEAVSTSVDEALLKARQVKALIPRAQRALARLEAATRAVQGPEGA